MSQTPLYTSFSSLFSGLELPTLSGNSSTVAIQVIDDLPDMTNPVSLEDTASLKAPNSRTPRFEGSEHTFIGEQIVLQTGGTPLKGSDPILTAGNSAIVKKGDPTVTTQVQLSYGQIAALAGDFYGIPDQPICTSGATGFLNAFHSLVGCSIPELSAILTIMKKEIDAVQKALLNGQDVAAAIHAISNSSSARWNQATQSSNTAEWEKVPDNLSDSQIKKWVISKGRYLELASNNLDHFGYNAFIAYCIGHSVAINAAIQATTLAELQVAYSMNAFADHFLSDLFAAGHLRTPRPNLNDGIYQQQLSARNMHNEDNTWGLCVQNANGNKWRCFGDAMYFTEKNTANAQIAKLAIQASADDIYTAYTTKDSSQVPFSSISYVPFFNFPLDYFPSQADRVNFSPLFVQKSYIEQLKDINNLNDYDWTRLFLYSHYDYFSDPKKYHPAPPLNYPLPSNQPTVVMVSEPGFNGITNWTPGYKVRYALIMNWTFNNFPGVVQSSDIGVWSDWVTIQADHYAAISLDNGTASDQSQNYLNLLQNANFVGWSFVRQIQDNKGNLFPFTRVVGPSSPGVVNPKVNIQSFTPEMIGSVHYLGDNFSK